MFYVGLDIHARQITICVLDDKGQVFQRCQVRQLDELMSFLERLPGPWQVCYEASTGYGMYFEVLRSLGREFLGFPRPSQPLASAARQAT
jgi:transposase